MRKRPRGCGRCHDERVVEVVVDEGVTTYRDDEELDLFNNQIVDIDTDEVIVKSAAVPV